MESKTSRGFQVITKSESPGELQAAQATFGVQQALFPFQSSHMLVFVSFPKVRDDEFVSALDQLHPGVIVELRKVPRFDFGSLNRKTVFEYFRRSGSTYFDLVADAKHMDDQVIAKLQRILASRSKQKSPFMFLVSGNEALSNLTETILNWLKASGERWDVYHLPQHEKPLVGDSRHETTVLHAAVGRPWELPNRGLSLCAARETFLEMVNADRIQEEPPERVYVGNSFSTSYQDIALLRIAEFWMPSFLPWEDEQELDDEVATRILYERPCWEERWK